MRGPTEGVWTMLEGGVGEALEHVHRLRCKGSVDPGPMLHLLIERQTRSGFWNQDVPKCAAVSTAQAIDALTRVPRDLQYLGPSVMVSYGSQSMGESPTIAKTFGTTPKWRGSAPRLVA